MNPSNELAINDQEKRLERDRASLLVRDPRAKVPLLCRLHRDPQGQPLKTALANKFPMLSRRERRELQRRAMKAHKRASKTAV
jgi:hypothetical protein